MIGSAITHISLWNNFYPGKCIMMLATWARGTPGQHQELQESSEAVVVSLGATLGDAGTMINCHMDPAVLSIAM